MERFGISCAVCGCGTEIIADGNVLLEQRISHERGVELRELLRELKLDAILEAQEAIYFSDRPFENDGAHGKAAQVRERFCGDRGQCTRGQIFSL